MVGSSNLLTPTVWKQGVKSTGLDSFFCYRDNGRFLEMMEKKKIKVPCLTALDALDLTSVGFQMERYAQREYINVINWKEYPYKPIVTFDIARTNKNLYIRYFVKGLSLMAMCYADDMAVHKDSCVEFFMQREGVEEYMNFEFNCIGYCEAARRMSREVKTNLTTEEYAMIRRRSSLGERPFCERRGVHAWELIVALPFSLMGIKERLLPEKIMGNFYKCADGTEHPHFVSWSPVEAPAPDFHRPEFFGEIYL